MNQTHDKCKYFGSKRYCPPLKNKNDIMIRATYDIPKYHRGPYQTLPNPPSSKEIDALCSDCEKFTPHRLTQE